LGPIDKLGEQLVQLEPRHIEERGQRRLLRRPMRSTLD
jgi:hypothetical protein